jgi:fatty acid desaturase
MEQQPTNSSEKDPRLWAIAKKRAGFKRDLVYFFVINAFMWIIWLLTGAKTGGSGIPWPVWSTVGWGIGMIIYYFSAFRFPEENATEKEYEKLKKKQ